MWYSLQDRRKSMLQTCERDVRNDFTAARTFFKLSKKLDDSEWHTITTTDIDSNTLAVTQPDTKDIQIDQPVQKISPHNNSDDEGYLSAQNSLRVDSTTSAHAAVDTTTKMSSETHPGANGVNPSRGDEKASPETSTKSQPQTESKDKSQPKSKPTKDPSTPAEGNSSTKLSGAELKKQKAAEKAARRAAEKAAKEGEPPAQSLPSRPAQHTRRSSQGKETQLQPPTTSKHQRKPSNQPAGPIQTQQPSTTSKATPSTPAPPKPMPTDKKVPFVSHLYPTSQPASLTTSPREIHPAVLTLALHLRDFVIAGSTARTVALLLTMKRVVNGYITPPNVALSWHLVQHIGRQIGFLSTARPNGIAQGNAIRWLKQLISAINVSLDEFAAKKFICDEIDNYIHVKFLLAGQVIAEEASKRISDDETILVFGKSSVVEKTLLKAAETRRFKVVVVDSRPLFEGRNLAKGLLRAGMREGGESECRVVYSDLSGLADVFEQHSVTKCFLGASGMLGNGSLYSRAGTSMVAMMAKANHVPVIVLSETEKFTSRMVVDSLVMNELGDAERLVEKIETRQVTVEVEKVVDESKKGKKKVEEEKVEEEPKGLLEGWKDQQNLYLLNLLYDLTPKEFLDVVICEMGALPPAAVPVVKRDSADDLPQ